MAKLTSDEANKLLTIFDRSNLDDSARLDRLHKLAYAAVVDYLKNADSDTAPTLKLDMQMKKFPIEGQKNQDVLRAALSHKMHRTKDLDEARAYRYILESGKFPEFFSEDSKE